jgi:sugar phosphate isomerase/epimerase
MKFSTYFRAFALCCFLFGTVCPAFARSDDIELGLQAWTFRRMTFAETLDQAKADGIHAIQAYSGQELGGGLSGKFDHHMDANTRAQVLALLKEKGVRLDSYGVINGHDEAEWREIFDFARAMGMRAIASEPAPEVLPLVDRLSRETGIRVALHNHPTPSTYANPHFALETLASYGNNIGLCADTGHWVRSGYDPVASLHEAAGRVLAVHFKDLTERGVPSAHDVPWGTGASDAAGQILELRRQHFSGVVFIEYEHDTPSLSDDVRRSAEYFERAMAASDDDLERHAVIPVGFTRQTPELWAGDRGKNSARWSAATPLFTEDLSNADFKPGSWVWENHVLVAKGGGDIWTKENYQDFAVMLEFRTAKDSNSGVFLRCTDPVNWLQSCMEIQILQGTEQDTKHNTGALYDCLAPKKDIPIHAGEWYRYVITAKGNIITVSLNGEEILKADLSKWTAPHLNPDGTKNKFDHAYKDMISSGRIGLQYHGSPIEFRNLFVERL